MSFKNSKWRITHSHFNRIKSSLLPKMKFMFIRLNLFMLFFAGVIFFSCEGFSKVLESSTGVQNKTSTKDDIVDGLKEALRVGTDTAVSVLHKTDGYYKDKLVKIMLPPEIQMIQKNMRKLGISSVTKPLIDDLELQINRAAEDAAKEASPIFVNAIKNMSIADGWSILKGSNTAATAYLKRNTYDQLFDLFRPKIETSLSKPLAGSISAASTYESIITTYNKAAKAANIFGKKYQLVDPSLSSYTTTKALQGLFIKVAEEEKSIRTDPVARVTSILKKVFG